MFFQRFFRQSEDKQEVDTKEVVGQPEPNNDQLSDEEDLYPHYDVF